MGDTITDLVRFIENNILEEVNVKNLESYFNYSERHIRRVFKQKTNISLYPYITNRKMTYALFDLTTNLETVKNLYLKYGYRSHDSFSRAFKRTFSVSPKNYNKVQMPLVLKEVTPNILAPLIQNNYNDPNIVELKNLYWDLNPNKVNLYVIDLDNYGDLQIENLINYGFSTHHIYQINHNAFVEINYDKVLTQLINNKLNGLTKDNLFIIFSNQNNANLSKLVSSIKEKSQLAIIVDESTSTSCQINNMLYHLTLLLNRTTSIKLFNIKSFFNPLPKAYEVYIFNSFQSIFLESFDKLSIFKEIIVSISVNKIIDVQLIKSIINHINESNTYKINATFSFNEKQENQFEIFILGK